MTNHYDNLIINIALKHQELNSKSPRHPFLPFSFSKKLFHRLLYRLRLLPKLIDAGLIRRWFDEFNFYWQRELGGRPLRFHDFFYLYSLYRSRYQFLELKNEADAVQFLADWQQPENIYQIFSCAYQYALNPFSYLPFKKYLRPGFKILEYGCGFAPLTISLVHYEPNRFNLTVADIPGFTFHYAKWKLKPFGVKTVDIDPGQLPPLASYDIIFIITVLEHLPNPLATIKHLTNHLRSGGHLVFDYIKSDATGLDTKAGLVHRPDVLRFISDHYHLPSPLNPDISTKTTVAQKI